MKWLVYRILAWVAALLATPWVWCQQRRIRRYGRVLTHDEREIAGRLGVSKVDQTFVLEVETVPNPLRWPCGLMEKRGIGISEADGITLGHGIYVSHSAGARRSLMAHELVHVVQYERAGSICFFLVEYIHQCLMWGYHDAAWEVEARSDSAKVLE